MNPEAAGDGAIPVSLIVATLGSPELMERLLASLAAQSDAPAFEVIIVDQSGTDGLAGTVTRFAPLMPIIHHRAGSRGASRARNLGTLLARGTWVGFPDDDCEFLPQTLSRAAPLLADQAISIIAGMTVDPDDRPNLARWAPKRRVLDEWSMFGCFTEATVFIRRDLFERSGGFDERFGPGATFPAAEGIDLMNRVLPLAGPGGAVFDPGIKLRHPTKIPPWTRWAVDRFHAYAVGAGAAIAKVPKPHMLFWGLRTAASAVQVIGFLSPWRGLAYGSRLPGLWRGWSSFRALGRGK